jgi:3-oxoadipate enol-lactonase
MTTSVLTFTVQGTGPNLVVLHSLLADHTSFEEVAGQLAEHFCVWVVSLPGFGKSAPPSRPDITAYADRIAAFLHSGPGLDSAVLGNGLGAFIALAVASRHPLRGDLIVANTLPTFSEDGPREAASVG